MMAIALMAAAGPEVVGIYVPAADVSKVFVPGTELRILSLKEFESRVAAAQRGAAGRRPITSPRLIRARHRARWAAGVLTGHSELVLAPFAAGPSEYALQPWTPAILAVPKSANTLGARDAGTAVLSVDASHGEQTVTIDWELNARPHSQGRGFTLGLPGDETTVLNLDLPRGWVASSQHGICRGPLAAEDSARAFWEIAGEAGRFDLALHDPQHPGQSIPRSGAWVSGPTEIDLRRSSGRAGELVNWTTEWRVEIDPRHPGRLEAELDPGLELIDVQGPAVRGYRIEPPGPAPRVTVSLDGGSQSAEVRFLAHAPVPSEGAWRVPAMRPLGATWTGGRTTVILDELHVVRECREEAGRLVAPGRGEPRGANRLTFEAESPRSVAELVFFGPRVDLACTVRGQLFISNTSPRIECRLDWDLHRGSAPELEVDLSPAWLPEQVHIEGLDDPVVWHPSMLSSGATRLHVMIPATVLAKKKWTLLIGATSTVPGSRGPLELPRVRAVEAAVVDEAWLAWADDDTMIRPTRARGLAWIDPAEVTGLSARNGGADLREALAWRWTSPAAEGRVERKRIDQDPMASIHSRTRIRPDRRELSVDGTLLLSSGAASLESIPLWIDQPDDRLASWRFRDEGGAELTLQPIEGPVRARLGFPREGSARALVVNLPPHSEKAIHFEAALSWGVRGSIPLLSVPREYFRAGTILVETPAGMRSRVETVGLGRLNPSVVDLPRTGRGADDAGGIRVDHAPLKNRAVHAFTYTEPGDKLELFTELLVPSPSPGVVREAVLTTSIDAQGLTLNRLRLLVHLEQAESLVLAMPAGSSLVRVHRDGAEVAPIQSGPRFVLPPLGAGRGPRSSTIHIDYATESQYRINGSLLHPELPEIGLPCLSFVWEIVTPASWKVGDCGPGLIANDRNNPADWPCGALGLWNPSWSSFLMRAAPEPGERLRALDDRLDLSAAAELTLAEWFSRWDAGPWPIVIDRLALNSAGLGPKSPCVPGRSKVNRQEISLATLQQNGLAMVPFPDAHLITTAAEAASRAQPAQEAGSIAETLAWGSDRTDRFQTPDRWRGEASPRTAATAGDEAAERLKLPPGRTIWRFSGASWPGGDSYVHLVDIRGRIVMAWIVVVLLATAWLAARSRLAHGWPIILAVFAVACAFLGPALPERYACMTAAGFAVALALLIVELARRTHRVTQPDQADVRSESSIQRRVGRSAIGASLVLLLAGAIHTLRAAPPEGESPILALFPYDGAFDPKRPVDRVILRLGDFDRLCRLAANDPTPPPTVTAVSAVHRIARVSAQDIIVESQIELAAHGRGPCSWEVPISFSREIGATLDGESCPVAILPGGSQAKVVIPEAGSHVLRLRRLVAATVDEGGFDELSLPINAMPTARAILEPPRDDVPQGDLAARGRTELKPDRALIGLLGPTDRIVIRWARPGPPRVPRAVGGADGLMLWDVHPAGDRLRSRLTYHQPRELSTIRLAHDPGLILRSVQAPGRSEVFFEDAQDDQWLLSIDPPLPPGSTLAIDCWRPWDPARGDSSRPRMAPGREGGVVRQLPRIQPVGVERFTGSLGVRRPGDWTGRLEPLHNTDPINDESFVKAWGQLPAEPLTLSGTSRFSRDLLATFQTGPTPSRVQVRPALQVRIESGRIAMILDAEMIELSGHAPLIEAVMPEGIQVTQVSGDGLMDWTISSDQHLHLIWERPDSGPRRRVRISGWIPLIEDPLEIGSRHHRVRTPWVNWVGAEAVTGSLVVSSDSKPALAGAEGLTPMPPPSVSIEAGGLRSAPYRLAFQVDDASRLGEIRWEPAPPRVAVTIESQMTLYSDFAQWVAVLRYDVMGGALDAIHLEIPVPWAGPAKLHLSGEEFQLTPEIRGSSVHWTITPRRPLWGSHRLVIHSKLPLPADREIVYPEVAPWGNGAFDAYLEIVNATGSPLNSEGSTGLQPIDPATHFQAKEFVRDIGTPAGAYRVLRAPWVLRHRLPRGIPESGTSEDDAARVVLADLLMTVMPDRSILGRAIYETVPDSGRMLTIELPTGSSILWAAVESNPTIPLRSGPGAWSIVLEGRREDRVCVIWRTDGPASSASLRSSGWPAVLPRAGVGPSRSFLEVFTPPGVTVAEIPAGFEPATMPRLEMARADWVSQSILSFLGQLDRSSGRDHKRLVALLINHELALRRALRSARWRESGRARSPVDPDLERIPSARSALASAVSSAGLLDDQAAAQGYLGESAAGASRPPAGIPEPTALGRIRAFGKPTAMIGITKGTDDRSPPTALTLESHRVGLSLDPSIDRSAMTALLLAAAAIAATLCAGYRTICAAAMAIVLAVAALTGGPTLLAGGLGLAAIGWRQGRTARA
jgi:hypothetical protein